MDKFIPSFKLMLTSLLGILTVGCAAFNPPPTPVNPGAENVIVDPAPASRGCRYLGNISADADNGSPYISAAQLEQNVINTLKNKAFELGGNYVDTTKEAKSFEEIAPGVTIEEERFVAGKVYDCSHRSKARKTKHKKH